MRSVGGYQLLRQIGCGGMSSVYEAVNDGGDHVALKLLHPSLAADEASRVRLKREVNVLRRVRSPYVAEVIDAELDAVEPFIVTELIDGLTLEKDVQVNGIYTEEDLVQLGEQLAEALSHVHKAGVLHRDMKPSNVMIAGSKPILIDFGIAQAQDATRLTQQGSLALTPGYCDPRVIRGAQPDEAADWWALAAVLAYAASGEPPFGEGSAPAVIRRVLQGDASLPDVDDTIARAFRCALAADIRCRCTYDELLDVINDPSGETIMVGVHTAAVVPAPTLLVSPAVGAPASHREPPCDSELFGAECDSQTCELQDHHVCRSESENDTEETPLYSTIGAEPAASTLIEPMSDTSPLNIVKPHAYVQSSSLEYSSRHVSASPYSASYTPSGSPALSMAESVANEQANSMTESDADPEGIENPLPRWARDPRHARIIVAFAWIGCVALSIRAAHWSALLALCGVVICDSAGSSFSALRDKRLRRGSKRASDKTLVLLRFPVTVVGAILRTAGASVVIGGVGYVALWLSALADRGVNAVRGVTWRFTVEDAPPMLVAGVVAVCLILLWFSPTSKKARVGARIVTGGRASSRVPRVLSFAAAALFALLALLYSGLLA